MSNADLTDEELEAIYDQVDKEIARDGIPTDKELEAQIKILNDTLPKQ